MKKLILVPLFLFPAMLFAQEPLEHKWVAKLNVTQLLDASTFPALSISAERKINYYFSLCPEIGIQLYNFYQTDTAFLQPRGFKASLEGRIYLSKLIKSRKESKRTEQFISLQAFYRKYQNNHGVFYSLLSDSTREFFDDFAVKKTVIGINIIYGLQFSPSARIVLELYAGGGILSRKVRNTNIEYDESKHFLKGTDLVPYLARQNMEPSSGIDYNACLGFRIGYRF